MSFAAADHTVYAVPQTPRLQIRRSFHTQARTGGDDGTSVSRHGLEPVLFVLGLLFYLQPLGTWTSKTVFFRMLSVGSRSEI